MYLIQPARAGAAETGNRGAKEKKREARELGNHTLREPTRNNKIDMLCLCAQPAAAQRRSFHSVQGVG